MISQLPLRASENNTLELFSQMQLSLPRFCVATGSHCVRTRSYGLWTM
jgi:hypothetical protein